MRDAADRLGVELAVIRAFAAVESRGKGFLESGHPVVLFERHYFHRITGGRFNESHPDLSHHKPTPAGEYGKLSEQPDRLKRAMALDHDAAVRSTSYGLFQVMGDNWKKCGYLSVGHFEKMMWTGADEHLRAFVGFVESSPRLVEALRSKDWHTAARIYNGPGYAKHDYAGRMAAAYATAASQVS